MIDKSLILKEIAQLRDIVNLGVCVGIYQTCNGKQFKHMPASDFINFLNLKLDKAKVHPLPRQKQRICYMLFAVSHTIALSDSPKHWIESMLELCDISMEYYDKHHKDFLSVGVSEKNKEYKEIIDESIKKELLSVDIPTIPRFSTKLTLFNYWQMRYSLIIKRIAHLSFLYPHKAPRIATQT